MTAIRVITGTTARLIFKINYAQLQFVLANHKYPKRSAIVTEKTKREAFCISKPQISKKKRYCD
jgi:hypothetical protein